MKTFFSRLSLILSLAILLTTCVRAAATNLPPPAPQQEILDVLSQKNPDMTLHGQATGPLVKCDTIPVAKTPAGGYTEYPELVLKDCNEPLAPGVPDISGLWVQYTGGDSILSFSVGI